MNYRTLNTDTKERKNQRRLKQKIARREHGEKMQVTVVTAREMVEETVSFVVMPAAGETETESQTLTQSRTFVASYVFFVQYL